MATTDLVPTSIISAAGWTGATVANLDTSDDARATDGVADELISCEITDAPGDFDSQNTITLKVEARVVGTVMRDKTLLIELLDSGDTVLQSFTTAVLTATDATYTSSAFARSDSKSFIDGYRLRATVAEGGGMSDSATVEIDKLWATLDYNLVPQFAQAAFRVYDDDGGEAASTPTAAENTDVTVDTSGGDVIKHLRFRIDHTSGGGGLATDDWQLRVSKNIAAFKDVGAGTADVQAASTVSSITFVAGNTHRVAASTGVTNLTLPGALQQNDFVVAVAARDNSMSTDEGVTDTGYTTENHNTGGSPSSDIAFKFMPATPDTTVEVTNNDATFAMVVVIQVFRNVNTGTPKDVASQSATGLTGSPDCPSITPLTDAALVLAIGTLDDDAVNDITAPSGYSNLTFDSALAPPATTDSAMVMMASKVVDPAAAEDPAAFGGTGDDDWFAYTMALRPSITNDSQLTDGGATTNRATNGISDPGAGSFVAGEQESANGVIEDMQITAGDFTEIVYAVRLVSADVVDGNTLDFRAQRNGADLSSYTVTPRITISAVSTTDAVGSASATGAASGTGASTAAADTVVAAGTGAASATGASTAAATGTAAGTGTASGVAVAFSSAQGTAAGTGAASGVGNAFQTATGTAAGTSTAPATGASTAEAVGTAAATGAATGAGEATGAATGTAAGTGAATGVGAATAAVAGTAAGTGAAAGVGSTEGVAEGAGTAAATGAASGIGASTAAADGTAAGAGAASGVGESTTESVGTAAATGAANGIGASAAAAEGAAAGTGTATATGQAFTTSVGTAAGTGAATAIGASTAETIGTVAGTGAATATGATTAASIGTAAGVGAVSGVGASTAAGDGAAAGTGAASGVGDTAEGSTAVGTAAGTGAATATGASTAATDGLAAATGAAAAIGTGIRPTTGTAVGTSTAAATGTGVIESTGASAGTGAASAAGASFAATVGAAVATGTAAGIGIAIFAATGTAAGVGAASGVVQLPFRTNEHRNIVASRPGTFRARRPGTISA